MKGKTVKKAIALVLALMFIFGCLGTASAKHYEDNSADSTNDSMSTASIASAITLTVNGVSYLIPGGAISTVGYGYNNAYTYVYYCQLACNKMYYAFGDSIVLSCNSYCGTVDGAFGPNTYNGIKGFQYWNNHRMAGWPQLVEDGVCGDATWTRLAALCA